LNKKGETKMPTIFLVLGLVCVFWYSKFRKTRRTEMKESSKREFKLSGNFVERIQNGEE